MISLPLSSSHVIFLKSAWISETMLGRLQKFQPLSQGCQLVPNLANFAKNHSFQRINIFLCQKFAIFERLVVTMNINKIYQIINTKTLEK